MKLKKLFVSALAVVMTLATIFSLAGCNGTGGIELPDEPIEMPESAASGTAAVHDPSVYYDVSSQTYYAFGTHYAVASSKDLVNWTQEVTDQTISGGRLTWPSLYGSESYVDKNGTEWPAAIQSTVELVNPTRDSTTTWAPDVHKIGSKYYMYYSLTGGFGSNSSAIGRVESDNVMGPYSNNTIIVESVTSSDSRKPNAIDPELFYDKDGTLWMVYGSFFGGIYIKELDKNGLPVEDGFGKLLWSHDGKVVEGPFIFYNDDTDYYYMMATHGDLQSDYTMRVARSKNPDGPYEDITGQDMINPGGGNKLAGNYNIANMGNNVALGHNSVVERRGEFFVVCHVRDAIKGMHHLETRRLYFNKEGWPVMAPLRYAGEEDGTATVEETAGTYDIVVHTTGVSQTIVGSVECTLNADGTISGALSGTWSMEDDYFVTLEIDGISYSGVICGGWRTGEYAGGVYCITATSADGNAIWAVGR